MPNTSDNDLLFLEYSVLSIPGSGGFATVYEVRRKDGEIRALKVLDKTVLNESDPIYVHFVNECNMLRRICNGGHPSIVRMYEPRLLENKAMVEMDFIKGVDLKEYVSEEGFLEYREVENFVRSIVGAVAYCHGEVGVVHNDLHSGNVKRTVDGRYMLLDFGLAIENGRCVHSSMRRAGALEFCPPEKIEAGGSDADVVPASDVYSLGILMYLMLAGRVPFSLTHGMQEWEVQRAHIESAPPAILDMRRQAFCQKHAGRTYVRDYPEWLDGVVMKCLAKRPEDRYADAVELLRDIDMHLDEQLEHARAELKAAMAARDRAENLYSAKMQELADFQKSVREETDRMRGRFDSMEKKLADAEKEKTALKDKAQKAAAEANRLRQQLKDTGRGGRRGIGGVAWFFIILSMVLTFGVVVLARQLWNEGYPPVSVPTVLQGGNDVQADRINELEGQIEEANWKVQARDEEIRTLQQEVEELTDYINNDPQPE